MASAPPATKQDEARDSRTRGTGFPVVPLPEAARILADVGKYGAEHTRNAFAQHLGHDTPNSGAFRTRLAAFKDWKLVTSTGDRIILTQLGRDLALGEETSTASALREAFLSCKVFAKVYEDSAKGVDLETTSLAKKAVLNHGVAAASGATFARSLTLSAGAAGLAEVLDGGKKVRFLPAIGQAGAPPPDRGEDASQTQELAPQRQPDAHSAPLVLRQLWSGDGAQVLLEVRSSRPLPASAFAMMGTAVEAAQRLAELVGAVSASDQEQQ